MNLINITELHEETKKQVAAPVANTSRNPQNFVCGRVTSLGPKPAPPQPPTWNRITAQEAKKMIQDGLEVSLKYFSTLPVKDREARINALIKGSSPTGFVIRGDHRIDANAEVLAVEPDKHIKTLNELQSLIAGLFAMATEPKVFDRGSKYLFFFQVPRGWLGYAGEVKADSLLNYYLDLDVQLKKNWEKRLLTEPQGPNEHAGYWETLYEPDGKMYGPMTSALLRGLKMKPVEYSSYGPGSRVEKRFVIVSTNVPHRRAHTLSFAIDRNTRQLIAWQPGRYAADMTPQQQQDRVVIASGELTNAKS